MEEVSLLREESMDDCAPDSEEDTEESLEVTPAAELAAALADELMEDATELADEAIDDVSWAETEAAATRARRRDLYCMLRLRFHLVTDS